MYSFVYGFICSLLPAWIPDPHARLNELIPPQKEDQQPREAGAGQDEQAQDNGHEHAD